MSNTNTSTQSYENQQIIRLDGKSKFVEALSSGFDINKVVLNFVEYDDSRKAGDRIVNSVMIYMDFDKFRVFAQDMISGRFAKLAKDKKGAIYQDLTGTPAEKLKEYGRERKDGKAESRKFSIAPSSKGFFITGESGPGEKTDTGLIKPAGKSEVRVSIPIDAEQAKALVLSTLAAMNAYEAGKQAVKQIEKLLRDNKVIK